MKKFHLPPQKERSFAYVEPNNSNYVKSCNSNFVKLCGGVVTYDLNALINNEEKLFWCDSPAKSIIDNERLVSEVPANSIIDNKRLVSEVWSEQKETKRAKLN